MQWEQRAGSDPVTDETEAPAAARPPCAGPCLRARTSSKPRQAALPPANHTTPPPTLLTPCSNSWVDRRTTVASTQHSPPVQGVSENSTRGLSACPAARHGVSPTGWWLQTTGDTHSPSAVIVRAHHQTHATQAGAPLTQECDEGGWIGEARKGVRTADKTKILHVEEGRAFRRCCQQDGLDRWAQ